MPMLVVLPSYEFRDHNQHRIISSTTIEIELNVFHIYLNYIRITSSYTLFTIQISHVICARHKHIDK